MLRERKLKGSRAKSWEELDLIEDLKFKGTPKQAAGLSSVDRELIRVALANYTAAPESLKTEQQEDYSVVDV